MDTRGQRLRDWRSWHATAFGLTRPDRRRRGRFLPMRACSPASGLIACRLTGIAGSIDSFPTLAEFLARHGYATAGFVANTYYCNARYGLDRGFARYEDFHENQTISLFEAVRCTSLGKCLLGMMGYSMDFAPRGEEFAEDRGHDEPGRPPLARPAPIRAPILPVPELLRRSRSLRAARGGEQAVWLVRTATIRTGQDAQAGASAQPGERVFGDRGPRSERDFNGRPSTSWLMATTAASPISTTRSAASSMS